MSSFPSFHHDLNQMSIQKWVSTPVQEERTSWVTLVFPNSCFLKQQILLSLQYSIFNINIEYLIFNQYSIFKSKIFPTSCFLKQQIFHPLTSSLSTEMETPDEKCECCFHMSKAKIILAWLIRYHSGEEDNIVTIPDICRRPQVEKFFTSYFVMWRIFSHHILSCGEILHRTDCHVEKALHMRKSVMWRNNL